MSFDSTPVCVINPCAHPVKATSLNVGVSSITIADSPFDPVDTTVVLANAAPTGGPETNLDINLTVADGCPNQTLVIKKTDSSTNTVTINPPTGETIDNGASYVLTKENLNVRLVRDDNVDPANWVITTNFIDQIAPGSAVGDLLVRTTSGYTNLPVGSDDQVLTADSSDPNGVVWSSVTGGMLTGATNVGTGTGEIFRNITGGTTLNLRRIAASTGITIDTDATTIDTVTITNSSPASSVTLLNAGGTSLINDGTGPDLELKGLVASTGITINSNANDLEIVNNSPASSVTLSSGVGDESLVIDGVGPSLDIKALTAGSGITLTPGLTDITISASSVRDVYSLLPGKAAAVNTAFIPIAWLTWIQARYSTYTSGRFIFTAELFGTNYTVRLQNVTAGTTVVTTNVAASGFYDIPLTLLPTADAQVELQISKATSAGTPGHIFGCVVEFS